MTKLIDVEAAAGSVRRRRRGRNAAFSYILKTGSGENQILHTLSLLVGKG
jgi:hypothetical protein